MLNRKANPRDAQQSLCSYLRLIAFVAKLRRVLIPEDEGKILPAVSEIIVSET